MENKTIIALLLGLGIGAISGGGFVCSVAIKRELRQISCVIDVNNDGLEDTIIEDRDHNIRAFIQNPDSTYVPAYVTNTENGLYIKIGNKTYNASSCILLPKNY